MALRRKTTLAALTAIGALTLAGCGGGDNGSEDDARETLTIGIANEQPYGYMGDDGKAAGFDPEIAREVLGTMGYSEEDLEFKVVEFGQLIGGLQAQQFDLVAAGMYINAERKEQVQFSDPDYCTKESFAVEAGNPENIVDYQSFAENPDLTMAVASGTVEVGYAEDAEIPDEQLKPYSGIDQMYDALAAGEVDAVSGTAATVSGQVRSRDNIEAVDAFIPKDAAGEETLPCGGFAFRLDDTEFRDEFNTELNKLREDGTTTEIITSFEDADGNPYFTPEDVELANGLTVDDFTK
ncbi:ectoine/hydroxyectoine ABC transporter substrate-binding protein EhuB [Myceligenerans salitolerans]|uniref:Ectoine/hydroxyectoine ABC transporter substrate-binding protein EhuB n=1 Tax=Myceligenerans salitolerans TaxID=1230528 RepID=A0ABS3IAS0_9MICO|nr:ectoine/hydroxyectoine ABC transporter substrate-binding protein EhuB [Myceligenerans salitolerans]MBO0610040.1 ectoine/hydroxyectoine ABC transporter substrate-binding protein EhuB [Myceligenerans salitolerans]